MRNIPTLELNLNAPDKFGNLAEKLDANERRKMATELISLIELDRTSMNEWLGKAKGYLDEAAAEHGTRTRNNEQDGSGEGEPPTTELTLTAVVQFSARATAALLGEPDLAKASENDQGAIELAKWVSSQLRTNDPNWTLDTDPLVVHMAVTGLAWRKRAFDEYDKAFRSHFLTCTQVIINANVRSVERAPRIAEEFERYPYEIDRSIERGHWVDYEPRYDERDPQAPKRFFECDLWMDLDGDEIDEPWTVVISRDDTPEVVKIAPRWSKKTIVNDDTQLFFRPIHRFYPYRFLPDPNGGFFPMGFGKLLERIEAVTDDLLDAIVDTAKTEGENGGVLAGGGFGLPDSVEVKGNRVVTVNTDGAPLANRFQMFPSKTVSTGSVAVLEKMMTLGDRIAGTLNLLENAPASMTATLAKGLIDNGAQVQSAVHRRMCFSMTGEFRSFVQMADAYDMLPSGVAGANMNAVAVTADPQLATEMQRSALGGVYMNMIELSLKANGQPFDVHECAARFCDVMRLPMPEKLIAAPPQSPEATPKEKMDGMLGLMKQKTEGIKAVAQVAVQLTQSLKNLVDANGGMQANQSNLLQMALLEQAVQNMLSGVNDAGNTINGMAQPPGNNSPAALPPPSQGGGGGDVSGQPAGDGGDAGTGGGIS